MDAGRAAHLLALMLGPTAAVGSVVWGPRLAAAARRVWRRSRGDEVVPAMPPIEQTARDLRRLLALYERERTAQARTGRAARLAALRMAISDAALDAARALEVPVPATVGREPLPTPALARLLAELSAAGLVIPGHEGFPGDRR